MKHELLSDAALDALVATTTRYDDDTVATLPLDAREVLDGITRTHDDGGAVLAMAPARRGRRRRGRRLVSVAAAAAMVLGAFAATTQLDRDGSTAWSAEMVEFAESTPRLLPAGDWRVDDFDDNEGGWAEMNLTDGDHLLEINWFPAAELDGYVADRAADGTALDDVSVLGAQATVHAEPGGAYSALFLHADRGIEVRAYDLAESEFRTLLGGMREVGVDEWLSVLPPGTVAPGERAAVVDEMLVGIPVPPGLDLAAVRDAERAGSRLDLGGEVTGTVACGWAYVWVDGRAQGDVAAEQRAEDAMATASDWPVVRELAAAGAGDEVLRLAEAMPVGTLVSGGGLEITVEQLVQEMCVPR